MKPCDDDIEQFARDRRDLLRAVQSLRRVLDHVELTVARIENTPTTVLIDPSTWPDDGYEFGRHRRL